MVFSSPFRTLIFRVNHNAQPKRAIFDVVECGSGATFKVLGRVLFRLRPGRPILTGSRGSDPGSDRRVSEQKQGAPKWPCPFTLVHMDIGSQGARRAAGAAGGRPCKRDKAPVPRALMPCQQPELVHLALRFDDSRALGHRASGPLSLRAGGPTSYRSVRANRRPPSKQRGTANASISHRETIQV